MGLLEAEIEDGCIRCEQVERLDTSAGAVFLLLHSGIRGQQVLAVDSSVAARKTAL